MGEFLKDNPILSHILIPLLLIFMFFILIGKPYVKYQDEQSIEDIVKSMDKLVKNDSIILEALKEFKP